MRDFKSVQITAGRPQRLDRLTGQRSLHGEGLSFRSPQNPKPKWVKVGFRILLFDQEPSSSLFSTIYSQMLHLSIKTSKKVNNFKKHQRLKDHYNWVWPTLVAPRQALATQWVALATVLKF